MYCNKTQSGLTLIEILVAFTIMAISVALVLQIVGKGNRSVVLSDEYNTASIIAESLLSSLTHIDSIENSSGIQFDKYAWQYSISPYDDVSPSSIAAFQLYEINISVSWNSPNNKQRDISLSTLRLMSDEFIP